MESTEQEFIERWRCVVRHVQEGAERRQAMADEIPPSPDQPDDRALMSLFTRQVEAIANHTVALNCLHALIAGRTGGRAAVPSV